MVFALRNPGLQHSIGKYISASGLEESLRETRVLKLKTIDSISDDAHYVQSPKRLLILASAVDKLKWSPNWRSHLHVIQEIVPAFCQTGSINYQQYCSLYLGIL